MGNPINIAERNRLREKGKTVYSLCPDPENWTCVLGFVDKYLPENPIIVYDFRDFLKQEILNLEKQHEQPHLSQTKKLLEMVEERLKSI